MSSSSLSDREKAGLHGPVKMMVDEYSTTVFDRNGKTLEWRGNTSHGHVERTYVYDDNDRLIRVTGSAGDHEDKFRYHGRGKTQIRHVPQRPDQRSRAFGIFVWFDSISEGDSLSDGGTVETTYNELDQPVEKRVFDDEGKQLFRVEYLHDANGRLSEEKLISENPLLPKALRDQIPIEQRAAAIAEWKAKVEEISQRTGLFGNAGRAYVYTERGQIAERHMRMGAIREDLTFSYNERGDISEWTMETSGLPYEASVEARPPLKCRRVYEYDSFGNWTSMSETSESSGNETTHTRIRQLSYHL